MLIYNFQKEFIGIDEKDLKTLGFKNLGELRTEVTDFADLFVKTPGFIHNFKHVHWIDFITCADSNEESKVIINVNNKNYRCVVHITTAYLIDNPTSKSFIINLQNLRELSHKESESIAGDIIQREAPQVAPLSQAIFNTPEHTETFIHNEENESIITDEYDAPLEIESQTNTAELTVDDFDSEEEIFIEEKSFVKDSVEEDFSAPLEISFDDDLEDDLSLDFASDTEEVTSVEPIVETEEEEFDNSYVYDPHVASEELGLPLDLIEEFIQDFIEQAKEFKSDLYKSVEEGDFDTLKILSHKLKGVAANLRIEDALEALTIANDSSDFNEVTQNLNILYKIIAKLAGEEVVSEEKKVVSAPQEDEIIEENNDLPLDIDLDFKEENDTDEDDLYSDPIEVEDSEVPEKIEFPELADDTFIQTPENEDDSFKIELEDDNTNSDEELTLELDDDNTDSNEELTLELEDESTNSDDEELTLELEDESTNSDDEELTLELDDDNTDSDDELTLELEDDTPIEYSKETVANEIGLDIESFNELFGDFTRETSALITSMNRAVEKEDFDLCSSEAIKLKGMSENMRITGYEAQIETLLHSKDVNELSSAIKIVSHVLTQLSK